MLRSRERGLTKEEATERFQEYGFNKLPEGKVDGLPLIFFAAISKSVDLYSFAAAGIVFVIGSVVDSLIIFIVLIFNAIVGTFQEGKAQNTLLALKEVC